MSVREILRIDRIRMRIICDRSISVKDVYKRQAEAWQRVETILVASDEADRAFLAGLLAGKPYTALENELYLSASALRYRLKRMLVLSGCDSRDALLELLRFCGGVHLFSEKTQIPEPPKTSR